MKSNLPTPIFIGFSIWMLLLLIRIPYSIFEISHVKTLLLAAPLWLIPIAWKIDRQSNRLLWIGLCCGLLFAGSFLLFPGHYAALMTVPWILLSGSLAVQQLSRSFDASKVNWLSLAGYAYLPVGALWAFCDRLAYAPLGYSPTIVLLTAVHFHYAGFILPKVSGYLMQLTTPPLHRILSFAIIAGVPLVALGISASHFGWPFYIEIICVSILTSAGVLLGFQYIRYGLSSKDLSVKGLFSLGGIALSIGMVLAFCYGWRSIFQIELLTIPWMYAVHGTCNAIGFAAPILIGHYFLSRQNSSLSPSATDRDGI